MTALNRTVALNARLLGKRRIGRLGLADQLGLLHVAADPDRCGVTGFGLPSPGAEEAERPIGTEPMMPPSTPPGVPPATPPGTPPTTPQRRWPEEALLP